MIGDLVERRLPGRERWRLWLCIAALTALGWTYLAHLHHAMPGMQGDMAAAAMPATKPWTPADVAATFVMWAVMMAAMMSAPAGPAMSLFAGIQARRPSRDALVVPLFALGYALVWIAYSALATLAQWWLHDAALLSPMMAPRSGRVAGVILVAAGLYQLTPLNVACLRHCRSPLEFFMTHWRDGRGGALAMGVRHGLFCLGCCWALMAVLFAVGVMNLLWVATLTIVVLLEKVAPGGVALARIVAVCLIAAGVLLALRPM